MLKKFMDGLAFGGGFATSFIVLWFVASYLIFPIFASSFVTQSIDIEHQDTSDTPPVNLPSSPNVSISNVKQFHELELEDQIKLSSVIALAKYTTAKDGKVKAVISEILKQDSGVTFYYKVGDEYQPSGYYPEDNTNYGDGIVIFFTGSPATMKMSMTYHGDRIHGLGDLPIELLKNKCRNPNS